LHSCILSLEQPYHRQPDLAGMATLPWHHLLVYFHHCCRLPWLLVNKFSDVPSFRICFIKLTLVVTYFLFYKK
jgi:hypothetical protein